MRGKGNNALLSSISFSSSFFIRSDNSGLEAVILLAAIRDLTNLTSLSIRQTRVSTASLCETVGRLVKLEELDISQCFEQFGRGHRMMVEATLRSLRHLRTLNISYNNILSSDACLPMQLQLHSLDISSNWLAGGLWIVNTEGTPALVSFAEALKTLTSLKTLNLSKNRLDAKISTLAPALRCLTNLETLDLSYNNLGADLPPIPGACTDVPHQLEDARSTSATIPTCTRWHCLSQTW